MQFDFNTVSFPGLGIGEFTINPTAIPITEHITIEWYAIFICIGILVAYFVGDRLAPRFGIDRDDLLDAMLVGLPAGFIGARLWYILGDLDGFHSFMDVIAVWNGGLAIYGGVIAAFIAAIFFCYFKNKRKDKPKLSFFSLLDLVSIGFMIGQIIGRWGNFANVEVFGQATDLPWRMGVGSDLVGIVEEVHPLFLYESLWNLVGLFLILGYLDFRKYRGEVFLFYTLWYGIGRAWMEPMRNPMYNLGSNGVLFNMVLAIGMAAIALLALVLLYWKKPALLKIPEEQLKNSAKKPKKEYESQFGYAKDDEEEQESSVKDEECESEELNDCEKEEKE